MSTKRSRELKYAAHTAACTFFLDGDGVCRRIMLTKKGRTGGGSSKAERCLGAQYVASLDPERPAQLIALPTAGAPMMFAHVDKSGRVSLVRTGPVDRFEDMESGTDGASLPSESEAPPASEPSVTAPRREASGPRREPRSPAKREPEERKRPGRSAASLELDLAALAATRDDNEPYIDGADRTLKHSRATLEAALKTARRLPDLDDPDDEERTMLRSPPPASDATPRVGVLPRRRR